MIIARDAQGNSTSQGSGFFVDPGLVVTNLHVIQGTSSGVIKLIGKPTAISIDGVLAIDEAKDLALLSVAAHPGTPMPVGIQDRAAIGSRVYAIGNPLGLEGTFSEGIVSGIRAVEDHFLLQITAPISPGSSGGPIVNDRGQLVGVAVASFTDGQNLNLAVPAEYVRELLDKPRQWWTLSRVPRRGQPLRASTDSEEPVKVADAKMESEAAKGIAEAQYWLGKAYMFGAGVQKDPSKAVAWFRKAAEQGHGEAQFALGAAYLVGDGVSQDAGEAERWLIKAIEQGKTAAWSYLSHIREALGDHAGALAWTRRGAEEGDAAAQFDMGQRLRQGQGVPQDNAQATEWFRKAANQGHTAAQYNLGVMYASGRGVSQDQARAIEWFRKAADQGYASAQFSLGLRYAKGEGVAQDSARAAGWFRKAGDQGNAGAQYSLGLNYYLGLGVPQGFVQAYMWTSLSVALATGDDQNKYAKMRDTIAAKMTPTQLAEAQRLAQAWMEAFEGRRQ